MNQSRSQKEPMSRKAKLYWAIGIVIVILVAALLIWHNFFYGNKNAVAATVGDHEYTTTEVAYYYNSVANNYISQAQQYSQLGMDMGYDTSLSPSEQTYNEEDGTTYADYFLQQALDQLQRVTILCDAAEQEGYTLSEEGQQSVEDNMDALYTYSVQSGAGSEESYLRMIYGRNMTKSLFEEMLTNAILADEYAQSKSDSFTYSDEDLETYYEENAASLDSYEYRYCYIYADIPESTTDEDGNTVEPTEEETQAAMDAASAEADAMVAEVQSGTDFNTAAQNHVDEDTAESYTDPEYNHQTDTLGSALSSTYQEWLTDDSYQTLTYRNIEVVAETTHNDEDDTDLPTEEQRAAAESEAQSLLEQWQSGDATAESFGTLAQENSDDESTRDNGGLNENANRDNLSSTLTDWLFADDRQAGDTTIVEVTDSSGNVTGYQILYLESFGEIRWKYQATNSLRTDDYNAWYEDLQASYPAELTEEGQNIPTQQ